MPSPCIKLARHVAGSKMEMPHRTVNEVHTSPYGDRVSIFSHLRNPTKRSRVRFPSRRENEQKKPISEHLISAHSFRTVTFRYRWAFGPMFSRPGNRSFSGQWLYLLELGSSAPTAVIGICGRIVPEHAELRPTSFEYLLRYRNRLTKLPDSIENLSRHAEPWSAIE